MGHGQSLLLMDRGVMEEGKGHRRRIPANTAMCFGWWNSSPRLSVFWQPCSPDFGPDPGSSQGRWAEGGVDSFSSTDTTDQVCSAEFH